MERGVVGTGFWSDLSSTQLIIPFLFCHLLSMVTSLSSYKYIKDWVGVRKLLGSLKAEADSPQRIRSYFEPAWVLCCFCHGHAFSKYMEKHICMGSVY